MFLKKSFKRTSRKDFFMTKDKQLVITIDGPAGAGKSTVGKALAKRMSYAYMDTGALYRAVAYNILKEGINHDDETGIFDLIKRINISLKIIDSNTKVFIDGEDITELVRTEEIGLMASSISAIPLVRTALLDIQKKAGEGGGIVTEGRDMGTIVFPNADVKFFLDANAEERINRRHKELIEKGMVVDLQTIEKDLTSRDKQDRERVIAPLKIPEGSVVIDSSNMNIFDVIENMMNFVNKKIKELKTL